MRFRDFPLAQLPWRKTIWLAGFGLTVSCTRQPSSQRGLSAELVHTLRTPLKPLAPHLEEALVAANEPLPDEQQQLVLNKSYWLNRKIFLSTTVERATQPGLTGSTIGYIPAQLKREGNWLILNRWPSTPPSQAPTLNAYPILSESETELWIDLSSPRLPYALAQGILPSAEPISLELKSDLDVLNSVEVKTNYISFKQLLVLSTENKNSGQPSEPMTLTVRTHWVLPEDSSHYTPSPNKPDFRGFFTFQPFRDQETQSPPEIFLNKIDASRLHRWEIGTSVPQAFVDSLKQAINGWNESFAKPVLELHESLQENPPLSTPQISSVLWNQDPLNRETRAFTNLLTHPFTGEILQSTIVIAGPQWLQTAASIYQSRRALKSNKNPVHSPIHPPQQSRWLFALNRSLALEWVRKEPPDHFEQELGENTAELPHRLKPRLPEKITLEEFQKNFIRGVFLHELGHSLGLRHNFKGSLQPSPKGNARSSSVMDYNDPIITSELTGPGDFDRQLMKIVYDEHMPPEAPQSERSRALFCSDEERAKEQLACLADDVGADPFAYRREEQSALTRRGTQLLESGNLPGALRFYTASIQAMKPLLSSLTVSLTEGDRSLEGFRIAGLSVAELQQRHVLWMQDLGKDLGEAPDQIRTAYRNAVLETLVASLNSQSPQAAPESFNFILKTLSLAVENTNRDYPLSARQKAVEGLTSLQSETARSTLKSALIKLQESRFEDDQTLAVFIEKTAALNLP